MKFSLIISFVFFLVVGLGGVNVFAGELEAKSGATANKVIQSCFASGQLCKPSQVSDEIAQIKVGDVLKFLERQETDPHTFIQCTRDSDCGSGHKCCGDHCKAVVTC